MVQDCKQAALTASQIAWSCSTAASFAAGQRGVKSLPTLQKPTLFNLVHPSRCGYLEREDALTVAVSLALVNNVVWGLKGPQIGGNATVLSGLCE